MILLLKKTLEKSNLSGPYKGKDKWKGFAMMETIGSDGEWRKPFTAAAFHGEKKLLLLQIEHPNPSPLLFSPR